MEKATPGGLKTLDFCIQPKITHDLSQEVRATIIIVLVANLLLATWLFRRKWIVRVLLLLFLLFLLTGMLLPAFNSVRESATAGAGAATKASDVYVETTATVGSYKISVLKPLRSDGLDDWLAENGFARLPKGAGKIVEDYISQGWVFVAIKLRRDQSGTNAPHPIKLVFPAKEAVYPMKLTSIAGGKPRFDLFVIGDDRAACVSLKETFCDWFSERKEVKEWDGTTSQMCVRFKGTTTGCSIGHSAICSLMWGGCVLTKFAGNIDAASMTKDIQFNWKPFESHQEHFWTQYGARCGAEILFVILLGIGNIACMIEYAAKRRTQPNRLKWYFVKRFIPVIACAAVISGICFARFPKLGDCDIQVSPILWNINVFSWRDDFERELMRHQEVMKRTEPEIADFLLRAGRNENADRQTAKRNFMTGGGIRNRG